jgi:predicted nucleotidyltransferase component of viral defense system
MKSMLHLTTIEANVYGTLQAVFRENFIGDNFALAGGTALALQIGHRKSIDLDIFSSKPFDVKELEINLRTSTNFIFQYYSNNSRMLFGSINNTKCDFVEEPSRLINPILEIENVNYFSIQDIAAMKLHAICGRGKKKDFFDIYALLQKYKWETLLEWFIKKYDVSQLVYLYRSILYFEDAENDPEIESIAPFVNNWQLIKSEIIAKCK